MADLLQSLVRRAREDASVLERRRPSFFEPRGGRGEFEALRQAPEGQPLESEEEVLAEPGIRPPVRTVRTVPMAGERQLVKRAERSAGGEPSSRSPAIQSRDTGERSGVASRDSAEPTNRDKGAPAAEPRSTLERVVTLHTEREFHTERRVEVRSANEVTPRADPITRTPPQGDRGSSQPVRERVLVTPAKSQTPVQRSDEREQLVGKSSSEAPRDLAARPPSVTPRAEARRPEMPAPTTAPQPIQVTIGRIEIRAEKPARPSLPRQRSAPKLSLEEYMRSRTGGSR